MNWARAHGLPMDQAGTWSRPGPWTGLELDPGPCQVVATATELISVAAWPHPITQGVAGITYPVRDTPHSDEYHDIQNIGLDM